MQISLKFAKGSLVVRVPNNFTKDKYIHEKFKFVRIKKYEIKKKAFFRLLSVYVSTYFLYVSVLLFLCYSKSIFIFYSYQNYGFIIRKIYIFYDFFSLLIHMVMIYLLLCYGHKKLDIKPIL